MINERKVEFIFCVNNEIYFQEACNYINHLKVPEGHEVGILAVTEAESMCAGYQKAMESSNAKYKVYLHQDVFIREPMFIYNMITLFQENEDVGMIGMIGGTNMPKTGMAFYAWNTGTVDCREPDMAYYMRTSNEKSKENKYVEAVDGMLIATQYDIPWRQDLFQEFDFYDVSQSFEFRKKGYQILVPYQEVPWVIHASSFAKLSNYEKNRIKSLKEYPDFFYAEDGFEPQYNLEWDEVCKELVKQLKGFLDGQNWDIVGEYISKYQEMNFKDTEMESISVLYEIFIKDLRRGKQSFLQSMSSYQQMIENLTLLKFLFFRVEIFDDEEEYVELIEMIQQEIISVDTIITMVMHYNVDKRKVLMKIRKFLNFYQISDYHYDEIIEAIPKKIAVAYSKENKQRNNYS